VKELNKADGSPQCRWNHPIIEGVNGIKKAEGG
jgi:hypothetical protein